MTLCVNPTRCMHSAATNMRLWSASEQEAQQLPPSATNDTDTSSHRQWTSVHLSEFTSPPMMGGYFPDRPMEPESGPAKTRRPIAGLHIKQHGLDKEQAGSP